MGSSFENPAPLSFLEIRRKGLLERARAEAKSQSHDSHHIDIVLSRAQELSDWCVSNDMSVDRDLLYAACCLHDLGRNEPSLHGQASIEASIRLAQPILSECGYDPKEILKISEIIRQHDQPDLQPDSLEALILKEADILAGLGAWGILRTIAWGIECGRSTNQIISTLREKMPARIASLKLPPSVKTAWQEWPLVNFFLAQLESQQELRERETYPGKYIVFEGTSGTGKETQAKLLADHLQKKGQQTVIICEPSNTGREMIEHLKTKAGQLGREISQMERALVLAADRYSTVQTILEYYLKQGFTVIEIRSFLSAMAYQGVNPLEMARVLLLNQFAPRPNLIFLLEVEPKEALRRIYQRKEEHGTKIGDFEDLKKLKSVAANFRLALTMLPGVSVEIVSANPPIEKVFDSVKHIVKKSGIAD